MDNSKLIEALTDIVGPDHVLSSAMDLALYSYDASLDKAKPDVVVLPNSTEEVSRVMPILGRGSATNLTGGTIPVKGGIVVHFSRMNRILEIDIPNRTATVEPGVITLDLQTEVLKKGFVYQPDPASQKVSTLGGRGVPTVSNTVSLRTISWAWNSCSTTVRWSGPAESPGIIPAMTSPDFLWAAREPWDW
jgi:glycolate oxidase